MTDCEKLQGRVRDICRGYDDAGNLIGTPQKRAKWKQYFHGADKRELLTLKQQERKERIKQSVARTQRLINWLTFFRHPEDRGVGDTAHRLNVPSYKSLDALALLKRLLAQCSCSKEDAIAKLNKDYPYK